jgi:zinc protease
MRCLASLSFCQTALLLAVAGVCAAESAGPQGAETTALRAAAALYEGIRSETLPNGLRVFLKPVHGAPVVTTVMAYRVGSADEDLDRTGLSHYLEHLMFKGTDKIFPGDIDRQTLRNGGTNNANTSEDCTIYHFDFAADRWPIALTIEAERMRQLRIDDRHEFQQEKGAVINELARNEDEPWDLEQKALLPLLFGKTAPYGHSVIGEREHVLAASAADIKAHYDRWYHPNNAVLVIAGGFEPEKALQLVHQHFAAIPAGTLPPRKSVPTEKPKRPARLELVSKFDSPRLLMGFTCVRQNDPDDPVLDVVHSLLVGGRTGRLYRRLVEGERVATSVGASNNTGRYPGWFGIQVELLKDKDPSAVEKLIRRELKRLADEPAAEAELKRARQSVLADAIFHCESIHGQAESIARGLMVGDLDTLKSYLPRIMAVRAADVQRVARQYLDPEQAAVVWSLPKKTSRQRDTQSWRATTVRERSGAAPSRSRLARSERLPVLESGPFSLKQTRRVELPNGLVLSLNENHHLPIVVAEAHVRRVNLHEPEEKAGIANLTGHLLQEGTEEHTGHEIAELIEDVGGSLALGSTGGRVKVLSPDRPLALKLLFECLARPDFPKEAVARERERLLATIDYTEQQPDYRAERVYHELAYGKHPFSRPALGRRKTVETLTRDDCVSFHRKVFVPNNTLVAIVGDFDSKAVIEEVKALTAGWKKTDLGRPTVPAVEKPAQFVQKVISMPRATQLHLYLGHVGIRRHNPDFYKLLVMDHILGTGPGFTDRLSARLRDRQGLAYTVSASIATSAGEEPGLFTAYIGTDPENFDKVRTQLLEEVNRIRDEKPAVRELEDARQYLIHSLPFRFTTNDRVAGQLLYLERNGLGFDYIEDYRKGVAAVTPEDVQAVARTYLDPGHMILVATGPVDSQGKRFKE